MAEYPNSDDLEWNRDNDNFDVLNRSDIRDQGNLLFVIMAASAKDHTKDQCGRDDSFLFHDHLSLF